MGVKKEKPFFVSKKIFFVSLLNDNAGENKIFPCLTKTYKEVS